MPKKLIKRYMPNMQKIRDDKYIKLFGKFLHDENLFHLNRHSVPTAFGIGLFTAFIPVPFQMLLAAALAILIRANLPISVALVWLTNPFTMPPLFYFTYKIGSLMLHQKPINIPFEPTMHWLASSIDKVWLPFLLGSLVCGIVSGAIGYFGMRSFWRWHVASHWSKRKKKQRR